MKLKTSLFAIAATGALIASASALTIDITGSTAGRSNVDAQIKILLGGSVTWAYDNLDGATAVTNSNRAVRAIYQGTYAGNPITIRTSWSGSAAGVRDISDNLDLALAPFLTSITGTASGQSITVNSSHVESTPQKAEIGFSDVFQTSTAFTTNTLVDESEVAVIPFRFLATEGSGLTNITDGIVNFLYGSTGVAPKKMFTGNTGTTGVVYGAGRNNESGTRITVFAETGYGVSAPVNQWSGNVSGGVITGDLIEEGDGGYASGGSVATLVGATNSSNNPGDIVGYMGLSDATTALGLNAVSLSYNGTAYSTDAVRTGQYSLWGYLHQIRMAYPGTGDGPATLAFYNSLATNLTNLATSGATIREGDMQVKRTADGALISPK